MLVLSGVVGVVVLVRVRPVPGRPADDDVVRVELLVRGAVGVDDVVLRVDRLGCEPPQAVAVSASTATPTVVTAPRLAAVRSGTTSTLRDRVLVFIGASPTPLRITTEGGEGRPCQPRPMPVTLSRRTLAGLLLVCAALLAAAPLARAGDGSIRRAMKPYKVKLTVDIGYLSNFSAPSRKAAPGALRRLSRIRTDLTGASRALRHQRASSRNGRRGRADVLKALHHALTATTRARSSARAARAGHRITARRIARSEQRQIDRAIREFETGGRLLRLF